MFSVSYYVKSSLSDVSMLIFRETTIADSLSPDGYESGPHISEQVGSLATSHYFDCCLCFEELVEIAHSENSIIPRTSQRTRTHTNI